MCKFECDSVGRLTALGVVVSISELVMEKLLSSSQPLIEQITVPKIECNVEVLREKLVKIANFVQAQSLNPQVFCGQALLCVDLLGSISEKSMNFSSLLLCVKEFFSRLPGTYSILVRPLSHLSTKSIQIRFIP